jgi:hypothetical protein
MGDHVLIRRVKAIHWGSNSSGPDCEVFSLITAAPDAGVAEAVNGGIENCIAIQPDGFAGGSVTAFNVGAGSDISFHLESHAKSPYIRNCYADFGVATPNPSGLKSRGIAMAWCRGGVIEGNHIYNSDLAGPYQQGHSIRDMIVRNNFYKNVGIGVQLDLGSSSVELALVDISESPAGSLIALAHVDGGGHGLSVGDRVRVEPDGGLPTEFHGTFSVIETTDDETFKFRLSTRPKFNAAGIGFRVFSAARAIVEGNVIELAPVGGAAAIQINDGNDSDPFLEAPDYVNGDVILRNNKIRYVDAAPPADLHETIIKVQGTKNVMIQNNVIDTISTAPLVNERCANATYFNNRRPSGKLLRGYERDSKTFYGELETDAEDAFILALLEKK